MTKKTVSALALILLPAICAAALTPIVIESREAKITAPVSVSVVAPVLTQAEPAPAVIPAPVIVATDDASRRAALLGTWQAVDSPTATTINGEGTFLANGSATGYTTATYVYNDGYTSDAKVDLTFQWKIDKGVLTLNSFVSDPAHFIKPTHIKRFEILSISQDSMMLKDLSDGEIVYRRRKPG
ncbi:MAG: lipocalin family protein [Pseudomonadota bacterium]